MSRTIKTSLLALWLCTGCAVGIVHGQTHAAVVLGTAKVTHCEGQVCDSVEGHPISSPGASILVALIEAAGAAFSAYLLH